MLVQSRTKYHQRSNNRVWWMISRFKNSHQIHKNKSPLSPKMVSKFSINRNLQHNHQIVLKKSNSLMLIKTIRNLIYSSQLEMNNKFLNQFIKVKIISQTYRLSWARQLKLFDWAKQINHRNFSPILTSAKTINLAKVT